MSAPPEYMFDSKLIHDQLQRHVYRNDSFAIFPYGENGVLVRYILERFFKIFPTYVIDNKLYRNENGIISLEQFMQVYQGNSSIILTIEAEDGHEILKKGLLRFVSEKNIIDISEYQLNHRVIYKDKQKYKLNPDCIFSFLNDRQ